MKCEDRDLILELTQEWKGERYPNGRPKVSDTLLNRLSRLTTEEAYIGMQKKGYKLQYEGDLKRTNPVTPLIGRAVTAVMVPSRPDVHQIMLDYGRNKDGRIGSFNQWVIDTLTERDVMVVDMCDQILYGTFVGGNLSTAIKSRTKTGGAVIWGGIRDLAQIQNIPDYQVFYRGIHPSPIGDVMLSGINVPTRIGRAICMPGDVVHGSVSGVIFIPPHLAEGVATWAEKQHMRDVFGFQRLKEGKYTSAQIDQTWWSEDMMLDFLNWFQRADETKDYRYLDWEEEMINSKNPCAQQPFDGVVDYSYH